MNLPQKNIWLRVGIGILLSVVSAILLTLSFPPYNLWPLIWVGFVPMMVAQFRVLPRRVSSLASAIAIGGWLGGYLTPIFAGSGLYMTWLPLLIAGISYLPIAACVPSMNAPATAGSSPTARSTGWGSR